MAKLIKVNGETTEIEIPKTGQLEFLQGLVGGYIEMAVYYGKEVYAGVICDEEGKLTGKAVNVTATDSAGYAHDVLVGDVVFFNESEVD